MKTRSRTLRSLTLGLGLCLAAPSMAAYAEPTQAVESGTQEEAPSYKDAMKISWDGKSYTHDIAASLVGFPLAEPNGSSYRKLSILNDGPQEGTMRVSVYNVRVQDLNSTGKSKKGDVQQEDKNSFYDHVKIVVKTASGTESKTVSELSKAEVTPVGNFAVEKGDITDIAIAYGPSTDSDAPTAPPGTQPLLSFDVLVEMGQKLPDQPVLVKSPHDIPSPASRDGLATHPRGVVMTENSTSDKDGDDKSWIVDVAPQSGDGKNHAISEIGQVLDKSNSQKEVREDAHESKQNSFQYFPLPLKIVSLAIPLALLALAMVVGEVRLKRSQLESERREKHRS